MQPQERQLVLEGLASSQSRLIELIEGIAPDRLTLRDTPDRWSAAEILEHLVVFENFILAAIQEALKRPAEPEKRESSKDTLALGLANARNTKFKAREAARPVGKWQDKSELIQEFRKTRAHTLEFAAETQADVRDHFFPHIAFGDLDCYQWLIVLATHTERHALQIGEIVKASQ